MLILATSRKRIGINNGYIAAESNVLYGITESRIRIIIIIISAVVIIHSEISAPIKRLYWTAVKTPIPSIITTICSQ